MSNLIRWAFIGCWRRENKNHFYIIIDTCTKPHQVAPFINIDCAGPYNLAVENKENFDQDWADLLMEHDSEMDQKSMPWRWQDSKILDAFPIIGNEFTLQ